MVLAEHLEEELAVGLYDREILKFEQTELKSGRLSPYYYNQRKILSYDSESHLSDREQRRIAALAIDGYGLLVDTGSPADHLYGIPQAGTAIGAPVAMRSEISYLWGRVGDKEYGRHAKIEGFYHSGDTVIQLDDVVTDAGSKLESAEALAAAGLRTARFVILFDRQEGGAAAVTSAGYGIDSVTNISRAAYYLQENSRIGSQEIESLIAYHEGLRCDGVASTFTAPGYGPPAH